MPKVDVIMPAYNAEKYLPAAIESVEAQTFDDWRIVLVDDGSTDHTAAVVASYAERLGPKLNFIQQANKGMSGARNTAIRNSSAEFLAMLDSDDTWMPNKLSESLKIFEGRPQVGLVYGFTTLIDAEGNVFATFDRRQRQGEGWVAPALYTRKLDLPCPTITLRRQCVEDVGLFDEALRATEDRDLWFRIALRYEVALVPKLIANYRSSPYSVSTDSKRMMEGQLQFIEKHYGAPGCGRMVRRIALSLIYRQQAEALGVGGRRWAGLGTSLRALALDPLEVKNVRSTGSLLLRCAGLTPSRP